MFCKTKFHSILRNGVAICCGRKINKNKTEVSMKKFKFRSFIVSLIVLSMLLSLNVTAWEAEIGEMYVSDEIYVSDEVDIAESGFIMTSSAPEWTSNWSSTLAFSSSIGNINGAYNIGAVILGSARASTNMQAQFSLSSYSGTAWASISNSNTGASNSNSNNVWNTTGRECSTSTSISGRFATSHSSWGNINTLNGSGGR